MLSLIRCAGKIARIAAGDVGCVVEGRVCNVDERRRRKEVKATRSDGLLLTC